MAVNQNFCINLQPAQHEFGHLHSEKALEILNFSRLKTLNKPETRILH